MNLRIKFRRRVRGELNMSFDSVSRLLEALPGGGRALREQLNQLKPNIDDTNRRIVETLKPSPKHDWTRSVEMKVMIVLAIIPEIPIMIVADTALTQAHNTKEAADNLYRFAQWSTYFLFTLSVALGLYAALSGIKGIGVAE